VDEASGAAWEELPAEPTSVTASAFAAGARPLAWPAIAALGLAALAVAFTWQRRRR
jgi:MYXO-CTERM domain-containing protein